MSQPLISVILPVYNGEKYLKDAIDSVLQQSYTNFELIIINDGSKDNSEKICTSYSDSRIRYFSYDNSGLAKTLNKGIGLAQGDYIARQDQDDISLPQRFELQMKFMEKNPDVILLGTSGIIINEMDIKIGEHKHPAPSSILAFDLMFDNPFIHSSVIFRKKYNGITFFYPESPDVFEDYGMWSEMSRHGKLSNLEDSLILYRHHPGGMSKIDSIKRKRMLYIQSTQNIKKLVSGKLTDNQIANLCNLYFHQYNKETRFNKKEIMNTLKVISDSLSEKYPDEINLIFSRLKDYEKVLGSRYNMYMRLVHQSNPVMLLYLKIEHKLKRYKSHV
jgi:glycosyltransferase involved in cell wall biosynthesis